MKIIEEIPEDTYEGSMDISIITDTESITVTFGRGEPEDNSLSRDLNDAFRIKNMLIAAYKAGERREGLEVE